MKKTVSASNAPAAVGPYSQAVWAGDFLYCSGQLGLDPATGTLAGADVASQAERSLLNVKAILELQGLSMADIVRLLSF